jgi:hypothetical protein
MFIYLFDSRKCLFFLLTALLNVSPGMSSLDLCKSITADLLSRPALGIFTTPVNPTAYGLVDYKKKVPHPMDLGTVRDKLGKGKYSSTTEWFSDASLVFQNALTYYPKDDLCHTIATYGMEELRRLAVGLNAQTEEEWLAEMAASSAKLIKLVSQIPTVQAANPIVATLRDRAEMTIAPSSERVVAVVERLNNVMNEEGVLADVWAILKEVQGMTCEEGATVQVDVDKLTPVTLTMLSLYVESRE